MKLPIFLRILLTFLVLLTGRQLNYGQNSNSMATSIPADNIQALKDTLNALAQRTDNEFFRIHCESIIAVINSKTKTSLEASYLLNLYAAFINSNDPYNPRDLSTYLQRRRPLILAWVSPVDGAVSFSWLKLPRNWDPAGKYPLFIELHGLWSVASNAFNYLTYPFLQNPSYNKAFEDGYLLSPWARGNYWYQGTSESDIWESITALENIANIDSSRKYICGHSMGGYGAMSIASKSPGIWAAVGIYAGALNSNYPGMANPTVAKTLKDVPVYFVCGTEDWLYEVNHDAYEMLGNAGNKNLYFTSFTGGHDYREGDVFIMYMWMKNFINDDVFTDINKVYQDKDTRLEILSCTNPVATSMSLLYSASGSNRLQICIYDLSGRMIKKMDNLKTGSKITFDVSHLLPGSYFLQLQSDGLNSKPKMFIKK